MKNRDILIDSPNTHLHMLETQISLTEQIQNALDEISQRTGKPVQELIYEAIEAFVSENQQNNRRALMRKAQGIWADREDLDNTESIRKEWNRF